MSTLQYTVRVLGIHEDGEWCAIALEMSLRGYGATFREALDELREAIDAQLSFALQHNTLDSVWVPAEEHYFRHYEEARRQSMRAYLERPEEVDDFEQTGKFAAADLALPHADRTAFEALA